MNGRQKWRLIVSGGVLLLTVITLLGCENLFGDDNGNGNGDNDQENGQEEPQQPIGSDTHEFNARDMDDNWRTVTADLRGHERNSALLYVEQGESLGSLSPTYLLSDFTNEMRPIIGDKLGDSQFFGQIGVAEDDRSIVILILDLGSAQDGAMLGGYFDPLHAFERSAQNPYSNEAPMVFLNSRMLTEGGGSNDANSEALLVTLAHELQHLNNFYYNVGAQGIGQMDTWIDEMLSAAAEYYYAGTQQHRIDYFSGEAFEDIDYNPYVATGQNHVAWGRGWTDLLTSYASTHMKMHWLRLHEDGHGNSVFRDIVLSDYTDARSVADSAVTNIAEYTTSDLDSVWKQLHTDWLVANRVNMPSGVIGYKGYTSVGTSPLVATLNAFLNDCETTLHDWMGTSEYGDSYALGPGEAVYVEPEEDASWGELLDDYSTPQQRYLRVDSDGWNGYGDPNADDELLVLSYDRDQQGNMWLTLPLPLPEEVVSSTHAIGPSALSGTSVRLTQQTTPHVIDYVFPAPNTDGTAAQSDRSRPRGTSRITPRLDEVMHARSTALEQQ